MPAKLDYLDPGLIQFASTDKQKEAIEAVIAAGSVGEAAKNLGVAQSTLSERIALVRRKAVRQGYAPDHDWKHPVPEPHVVKGVSTYYNKDGKPTAQWVKTGLRYEQQVAALREVAAELSSEVEGRSRIVDPIRVTDSDLLTVYPIGDPHIGMYAWGEEAGEDFDTYIASADLRAAIEYLIDQGPHSETGIVLPLGDIFHADNFAGMTSRSGHRLDVDTRWPHVLRLGVKVHVAMIEAALRKHQKVVVRCVAGNHDDATSMALGMILEAYFRNNDRVYVDTSPSAFWYYEFGNTLIGSTHGHEVKVQALPHVMAHDMREAFGRTLYRYWYTGHWHEKRVHEFPTCIVEVFRTLASRDAWATSNGYRSGRDVNAIVHHKKFGEIQRYRADLALVREQLREKQ